VGTAAPVREARLKLLSVATRAVPSDEKLTATEGSVPTSLRSRFADKRSVLRKGKNPGRT
jgi:hypothetical protein